MKKLLLTACALIASASMNTAMADQTIEIKDNGIAIVKTTEALNFHDTGLITYYITGVKNGEIVVKQTSGDRVLKDALIIVKGEKGTYTIPTNSANVGDALSGNILQIAASGSTLKAQGELSGLLKEISQIKTNNCGRENCYDMSDFSYVTTLDEALSNLIDGKRNTTFSTVMADATTNLVTNGGSGQYGHLQFDLLKQYTGLKFSFIGRTGDWPDNPTHIVIYGSNDAAAFAEVDPAKNTDKWTQIADLDDIVTLDGKTIMSDYYTTPALSGSWRYIRVQVRMSQLLKNGVRTISHFLNGLMGYEYGEVQMYDANSKAKTTYKMDGTGNFVKMTADETVSEDTPYLQVEDEGYDVIRLSAVTGIGDIKVTEPTADNAYYDLMGRRVVAPKAGVYIHQGKKVVIK